MIEELLTQVIQFFRSKCGFHLNYDNICANIRMNTKQIKSFISFRIIFNV
jgi:hypothetical protein